MPDISVFRQKLKELADAAREKLPDIATTLSLSAKALAERRIKAEGFGIDYSETLIPAWFLHGKELNQAGTSFLAAHGVNPPGTQKKKRAKKGTGLKKEDRLANWKQFREAQGLQAGFVDLSYTNKMWAGMGPLSVVINNDIYTAALGATNAQSGKEMDYNFDRFGDFIGKGLLQEDLDILAVSVADDLKNLINEVNI